MSWFCQRTKSVQSVVASYVEFSLLRSLDKSLPSGFADTCGNLINSSMGEKKPNKISGGQRGQASEP